VLCWLFSALVALCTQPYTPNGSPLYTRPHQAFAPGACDLDGTESLEPEELQVCPGRQSPPTTPHCNIQVHKKTGLCLCYASRVSCRQRCCTRAKLHCKPNVTAQRCSAVGHTTQPMDARSAPECVPSQHTCSQQHTASHQAPTPIQPHTITATHSHHHVAHSIQ
jgi:hypothetical protein